MCPHSHQALHGEGLQRLEGLVDTPDPAGHLTGTVDVVGLHVLGETILWRGGGGGGEGEGRGEREGGRGERGEGGREGGRGGGREGEGGKRERGERGRGGKEGEGGRREGWMEVDEGGRGRQKVHR